MGTTYPVILYYVVSCTCQEFHKYRGYLSFVCFQLHTFKCSGTKQFIEILKTAEIFIFILNIRITFFIACWCFLAVICEREVIASINHNLPIINSLFTICQQTDDKQVLLFVLNDKKKRVGSTSCCLGCKNTKKLHFNRYRNTSMLPRTSEKYK